MQTKNIIWNKYESPITKFMKKHKKKNFFMQGANGIMFPDEAPDVKFQLFDGDCDFLISQIDFMKIAKIKGIEVLTIVTPYRLRVGAAKLFNSNDVLTQIDKALNPYKGVHEEIINQYKIIAENKYEDFVLYEDMYKMIHITNESGKQDISDGFFILSAKSNVSGV